MNNNDCYKVWISSFEHLEQFKEIAPTLKWWKQLLNIQRIEKSFPKVLIGGRPSPILFYSIGELFITDSRIKYKSEEPEKRRNFKYESLDTELIFEIDYDEISRVSFYKDNQPFNEKFNYPWIKIDLIKGNEILISNNLESGKIEEGLKANNEIFNKIDKNIA